MQKNDEKPSLSQLKQEVRLTDLAMKSGIALKQLSSGEYAGLCPFHDDKSPSLHINSVKNVFHCKGCGKGGSVVDWLKHKHNLDEAGAIAELERMALSDFSTPKGQRKTQTSFSEYEKEAELFKINGHKIEIIPAQEKTPVDLTKVEYQKLFKLVLGYYHNKLKESKEAISYLVKRGLKAGELLEAFLVGYCDGSLLDKLSLKDDKTIQQLKEVGILNDNGNERFYRCLLFPLYDLNGNVVQIYGRSISSENGSKHNLLSASLAGVFNRVAFHHSELFVCESIIDAISLMTLGYSNVTSTLGVNGITNEFLDILSQSQIKKVYICYDKDKAGDEGALRLCEKLKEFGVLVYRVNFSKGTDANEFLTNAENHQTAIADFKILIESAEFLFDPNKLAVNGQAVLEEVTATDAQTPIENYTKVGNEIHFTFGPRKYLVRGLENNKDNTSLKVFLKATLNNSTKFHIDNNLDLFTAKAKTVFVKYSAAELEVNSEVIKEDLSKIISVLDELLKKQIEKKEDPAKKKEYFSDIAISYKARKFLEEPLFIVQFCKDVNDCGVVGENLNVFFGFTATLSRMLTEQLNVIVQSESSSGKSTVVKLISSFVPVERLHYFTQITPKSFYYMEESELWEMVIAIAEAEGMDLAIYPIKQMISENALSIVFTKTDPKTGDHTSSINAKKVKGLFLITAPKEGLDEELENRCVILTLDESIEQNLRVQEMQRKMKGPEGEKILRKREELSIFYQHVQREIKKVKVANDYSKHLIFSSKNQRSRRDNQKYLTLIECITLLFQYQSERILEADGSITVKTNLIHIILAHFLMRRVFGSTLDELPPQTRKILKKIIDYLLKLAKAQHVDVGQIWFTRKQIKELTDLSMSRVHEHILRLLFQEYFVSKRDANGYSYRLNFTPDEDGEMTSKIELVSIKVLLNKASTKDKEQYEAFKPYLVQIFKALDPNYIEGEL